MWLVENNPPALPSFDSTGKAYVDLVLKSSDEDTMRIWPYR
jgi:glucose-6-phosphate 1-epimerase